MENIIEVEDLRKRYGNVQAVKKVDFSVKKGQLFAFLGPNGAGKSTTINTLCTLLKPDSGRISICGYDLLKQADKVRQSIGSVFQESLLDSMLTVRENLEVRAGFYYSTKREIKEATERAIKAADVYAYEDRPYGKLSGGQKRRADIARALINTPKVLFLDEPTTGLDPQTRKHVWETILKLKKENEMTIFLTTHYMEEAAEADYVVVIDNGSVAAEGTPYTLKEKYSSEQLKIMATDFDRMKEHLNQHKIAYECVEKMFRIKLKTTKDAMPILTLCESLIESFEVLHGTMDDVFIAITGKEIRE